MGITDQIIDAIQQQSGKIIQALLEGLKVKSYQGLTVHIKSDEGFKFRVHDKKVKGKAGDKVISTIEMPIDITIKIDPKIELMLGEKK